MNGRSVRDCPILNGLPQREGRDTITVFGGILQPRFRDSCTRTGLPGAQVAKDLSGMVLGSVLIVVVMRIRFV